jgi:uncharacterized protein YbcV (DUF1398 family)
MATSQLGHAGVLRSGMTGGVRREQVREQFRRYCETASESGMRRWAATLAAA